ncbi:MAG: hypothetical protein RJA70_5015 [Pseudomonadota bacterium]|jgi:polyisoprenoid-binding protein YceI
MKLLVLSYLAAVTLGTVACDNNFNDKPAAKVQDKTQAVTQPKENPTDKPVVAEQTQALVTTLNADRAESSIGWVGAKVTGKHEGLFTDFVGTATLQGDTVKGVSFEVKTASVTSDDAKLTGHLKSGDFFDVAKHPDATFKTTAISQKPTGVNTHEITGDLTLRGVTKSISFPAKVTIDAKSVSGAAEFTINRKDFGIQYPGMKDDLIKDDVLLKLNLVFLRG